MNWADHTKQRVARFLATNTMKLMQAVKSIPVFRHKPRELMTTFRKSVEALQQGANLLIFPEDPDTDPNSPGYKSGRPPTLFRGFPMLAQIYYNRTGKRCRFLPMLNVPVERVCLNPGSVSIPKENSWHGYMTLADGRFRWMDFDGNMKMEYDIAWMSRDGIAKPAADIR